ncbi:MAG: hypothetical protein J6W84_03565 [Bacteroidales bacterium]|nr:hypothetical protein [Bacteroidales bacterium]
MKESWIKEKARNERKAAEYTAEMEQSIRTLDKERFLAAYMKSARYMRKRLRDTYYRQFLAANKEYRDRIKSRAKADADSLVTAYATNHERS